MRKHGETNKTILLLGMLLLAVALPSDVFASTTGTYEWESTMDHITRSLTGPMAYGIAILGVFSTGCIMAFTDLQQGSKRLVQVGLGLSVALGASSIVTGFLGFTGAVIG